MTVILTHVATAVVAFILGVFVYRNNTNLIAGKAEEVDKIWDKLKLTDKIKSLEDKVDSFLTKSNMEVFLELGGTFISGSFLYLVLEASKYVGSGFDFKVFYQTNIRPLKWAALGSVVLILVYSFVPQFMPFVESQAGEVDVTSYEGIILTGGVIGALIKNFFRKKRRTVRIN
jgi:hypothetical protein